MAGSSQRKQKVFSWMMAGLAIIMIVSLVVSAFMR